ncbi:regulatory protein [Evansella vedderi]|uniref:Regulatory protein RecX n=1 Tax=Evansella vedderi TaxID=38282 RepID=A0ABU0A0W2_9BACI|nr:recombination regulator RecX [Evansella vedderi]MDQ0256880.1 regulatory protein [Evansella vedderi]
MPIITKISVAKRNKGRFHIYLDKGEGEEYAFTVSEDVLVKRQLIKGRKLTEKEIEAIREEDVLDKAFQKALNFLSYRMRSKKEVLQYLKDQEVQQEEASQLLDRLKDLNLLDDQMFAAAFVRTKKNTQKKGPLIIEQELYEKGISQRMIDKAMEEYPVEEQLNNAMNAASKKLSSYKSEAHRQKKQKLGQFLMQRGFTSSVVQQAVEESMKDNDDNLELEAIRKQGTKAVKKFSKLEGWEREQRIKQHLYQRGFSMEIIEEWLREQEEEE